MSKRDRLSTALDSIFSPLPPSEGAAPALPLLPGEVISLSAEVQLHAAGSPVGQGTLWVSNLRVAWTPPPSSPGYSLDYRRIALHAVCRDTSAFPVPCVYLQVSPAPGAGEAEGGGGGGSGGGGGGGAPADAYRGDVFFAPTGDDTALEKIFAALTKNAELHPDEEEEEGEEGGGGGFAWMQELMAQSPSGGGGGGVKEVIPGQFDDT
jgi:hypothetical protein